MVVVVRFRVHGFRVDKHLEQYFGETCVTTPHFCIRLLTWIKRNYKTQFLLQKKALRILNHLRGQKMKVTRLDATQHNTTQHKNSTITQMHAQPTSKGRS